MIHEPPLLTVKRHFPRPTAAQLAAVAAATTGWLVDAQDGRGDGEDAGDHGDHGERGPAQQAEKRIGPPAAENRGGRTDITAGSDRLGHWTWFTGT